MVLLTTRRVLATLLMGAFFAASTPGPFPSLSFTAGVITASFLMAFLLVVGVGWVWGRVRHPFGSADE